MLFAVFVGFLGYGITCKPKYSTQDCYWYVSVLGSCAVFSWDSSIVKCTKIYNLLYMLTLGSGLSIDGQHLLVILGQNRN